MGRSPLGRRAEQKDTFSGVCPPSGEGRYGEGEHVHSSGFALPVDSLPELLAWTVNKGLMRGDE